MLIPRVDLGDSSAEGERAAMVDDVVKGFLVVTAFASCCVFEAPFAHEMSVSPVLSFNACG